MSRTDKPEMVLEGEQELETFEDALRGKYQGTSEDERDMRVLGKTQVLNVRLMGPLSSGGDHLTSDSATSASSRRWDLLAR